LPHAQRSVDALLKAGIDAAVIGRVVERADGLRLEWEGNSVSLPAFEADELTRVL